MRDDFCKRRLTGSRRTVQYDGTQLIRFDCTVQQLIFSYNMLLPHHLIQRRGAKSGCKRRLRFLLLFSHIFK